jgi:hypothetical protein
MEFTRACDPDPINLWKGNELVLITLFVLYLGGLHQAPPSATQWRDAECTRVCGQAPLC